jgi:SAM-dependent methyltransferase
VNVKGEPRYQFAARIGSKETHENLTPGEAAARVSELFGATFEHCHLYTAEADYSARLGSAGQVKFKQSRPTGQTARGEHNRPKQYLIPENVPCPFLVEIGVMTPVGKVRASRYHKFRQVNRFLELVDDALEALPAAETIEVVDFGCGKSYLTFALHHLLTAIRGRAVRIVGLDRNAEVIRDCTRIAERLNCRGLRFAVGDIAGHQPDGKVDLAVSLHACDTATDDALAQAVKWRAAVILAVPCCQHELAPKLRNDELAPILQHGLLKERFAALATDALRAQALELCGYKTQVVEFIDLEHTPKNLLIRAVRRDENEPQPTVKLAIYRAFKESLGLTEIHLESALGAHFPV